MKDVAIQAAKAAGKLLMDNFGKPTLIGTEFTELNPVTKEDKEAEKIIIEIISSYFPDHAFLGEELGASDNKSDYKWIIDPIDGTNNYVDSRDSFSVSIALEEKGVIVLGVVYLPKRDELFLAELGSGATLNGSPINVSSVTDISEAVINYSVYPGREHETSFLDESLFSGIPKLKFFGFNKKEDIDSTFGRGSLAAEFCYVACGRIDGLIRLKQAPWDTAAGSLIASEAGAEMVNLIGETCSIYEGDYVCANPDLLAEIRKFIPDN